jgi:hypothetical protein
MAAQIEGYRRKLREVAEVLAAAQVTRDAESAWERVVALGPLFAASDVERGYNEIRAEADLVVSFMRMCTPVKHLQRPEACEAAIAAVSRWRAEVPNISDGLRARVSAYEAAVQTTLAELNAVQRRAAEAWLGEIASIAEQVASSANAADRAPQAARLLNRITAESLPQALLLDATGRTKLAAIEQSCKELVDSDREAQVFALLGQLSVEKQAAICRKLAASLHLAISAIDFAESGD